MERTLTQLVVMIQEKSPREKQTKKPSKILQDGVDTYSSITFKVKEKFKIPMFVREVYAEKLEN